MVIAVMRAEVLRDLLDNGRDHDMPRLEEAAGGMGADVEFAFELVATDVRHGPTAAVTGCFSVVAKEEIVASGDLEETAGSGPGGTGLVQRVAVDVDESIMDADQVTG